MRPANRDDLLVLIATLCYEQDLNQQAIAERLQISRSNISRLLQEAKERGIVEIRVRKPVYRVANLELQLSERFGIKQALVLETAQGSVGDNLPGVAAWLRTIISCTRRCSSITRPCAICCWPRRRSRIRWRWLASAPPSRGLTASCAPAT